MDHHPAHAPDVPPDLVADRRKGWHEFTRFIAANIVGIAALLVFLLLAFKVF